MVAKRKERPPLTFESPDALREHNELDRFLTSDRGPVQVAGLELRAIRLDAIAPDPDQPRKQYDPAMLADLAESVRRQGIIQPIEVEPVLDAADRFIIVHGERRWRAANMAGLETIPAIIRPMRLDRATRLIRQLIENLQREDLNDMDRAAGLVALRGTLETAREVEAAASDEKVARVTWEEVGQQVGVTKGRISQLLGLLALPEPIQDDVRAGRLTEYDVRPYKGLSSDQQVELHQARSEQTLDAQQVRQAAKILKKDASRPVDEAVRLVTAKPPEPLPVEKPVVPETVEEVQPPAPPVEVTEEDAALLQSLAALPTERAVATLLSALRALMERDDVDGESVAAQLEDVARALRKRE